MSIDPKTKTRINSTVTTATRMDIPRINVLKKVVMWWVKHPNGG